MNSKRTLDARHLICPLPVIRTQQTIDSMQDGERLLVIASDPGTMDDVPAWCRVHGHQITDCAESKGSTGSGYECGNNPHAP